MTARILILLAALGATGLAVRGQYHPAPSIQPDPLGVPVAPFPPQGGGGPLPPMACPPGAGVDRLLQVPDGAGIDDMIRQLAAVRAKRDEIDRFEKHLVGRLQEKVKQQSDQLKRMGVVAPPAAESGREIPHPTIPSAPPAPEAAPPPAPVKR